MPRDNQRQRLYDSEKVLEGRRVSRAAKKHLIDTQHVAGWGVRDESVPLPPEDQWPTYTDPDTGEVQRLQPVGKLKPMKAPTIAALQDYVDAVTQAAWFQARWGQRKVTVRPGKGSHGSYGYVTVSQYHRRSEEVILHEIAHGLVGGHCAAHGPEFAGVLLTLVRYQMGKEYADALRASFKEQRVRYSMAEVPAPRRTVVTKAQRAAKTSKRENLGDRLGLSTPKQREVAASIIRAQVKDGLFGPSGCKPRAHALATARLLEKGQ